MKGINQYKQIALSSEILSADPYRVIQMMMEGFLDRLVIAKSMMVRKDYAGKGIYIGKALSILEGLVMSLDNQHNEEIFNQLSSLYQYMTKRLWVASAKNDPGIIEEVQDLMITLKDGWDHIPEKIREQHNARL